ncbi:hypothetical protein [Burkholderia phage FLC6]|nr:hypothetical protein [Burkholderia phage FLC6]BDD79513.1 hypothetical protein [Burkholderia phage FLC8]
MALLPTYSPSGFVSNPLEKADYMLAHFFTTQKSQTQFYKDKLNVTSYQSLIADSTSDGELTSNLNAYLNTYFSTQFTNVQMDCNVAQTDPNDNTSLTITIGCSFVDDQGIRHDLSRAIDLLGTQVQRIYNVDATGSPT